MATGIVKWFNNAKGYGFICSNEGGDDVFAHFSAITMSGYKTLKAGQVVEFEISQGPKGLHAVDIRSEEGAADDMSAAPVHQHTTDVSRPYARQEAELELVD